MTPTQQGYYGRTDADILWTRRASVDIRKLTNELAILLQDLLYVGADGSTSIAEQGFVYDGGSKPRITWLVVGHPYNEYLAAYTIHDADVEAILRMFRAGDLDLQSARKYRRIADRRFKEGLRYIKRERLERHGWFSRFKIRAKYLAVRCQAMWRMRRKGAYMRSQLHSDTLAEYERERAT